MPPITNFDTLCTVHSCSQFLIFLSNYRDADKSLARPGRK